MTKSEIILSIILKILHSPSQSISMEEFKKITGKSKSTYYRYIEELTSIPFADGSPLLIETQGEESKFTMNKSIFKYFVPEHLESAFFLEAYKKIGSLLQNENFDHDISNLKKDIFNLNGKAEELSRKFYHLAKVHNPEDKKTNINILNSCVSALIKNKTLNLEYNNKIYSNVLPLSLLSYREALYLIGCKEKVKIENIRKFKLSRVNQINILEESFIYPTSNFWDPSVFFENSSGIVTGKNQIAEIKVYGVSRKIIREKTFFSSELLTTNKNFDQYQIHFTNFDELLGQLFVYAQDIEIVSPLELKDEFIRKAESALGLNKKVA